MYCRLAGRLTVEQYIYVAIGFLVLVMFAAMLGLHSGFELRAFANGDRQQPGDDLLSVHWDLHLHAALVEARSSFAEQFASFLVFILAGSIALYASLSHAIRPAALMLSAGALPFLTFYAITEFLLQGSLGSLLCGRDGLRFHDSGACSCRRSASSTRPWSTHHARQGLIVRGNS